MIFSSVSAQNCNKFGVVNRYEIILMLPEAKLAQGELEKLQKQQQILITDMEREYQLMIENIKNGNSHSNKDSIESTINEIEQMERKIWSLREETENLLMKMENNLYAPIIEKVNTAIKNLAILNGICLIFDSSSGAFPYYDESIDITDLVKKELSLD